MIGRLLCITHEMPRIMSCTLRDVHIESCERQECGGCVPREAEHGYLCASCWFRLEHAVSAWEYDFLPAFAGEVRAVQPEAGGGGAAGSTVPLSALQLAMDEILRFQRSRWASKGRGAQPVRLWVTTPEGAADAVQFTRAVERALRAFPRAEGQRRIPTTRCPKCKQRTLVYEPAQTPGGDATVRCLSFGCGNVMDHTAFERIALIEAQCCRRCRTADGCANDACTCHRFAPVPEWERTNKAIAEEAFNPARPEHEDFDPLALNTMPVLRKMAAVLGVPRYKQLVKADLVAAIHEAETNEGASMDRDETVELVEGQVQP